MAEGDWLFGRILRAIRRHSKLPSDCSPLHMAIPGQIRPDWRDVRLRRFLRTSRYASLILPMLSASPFINLRITGFFAVVLILISSGYILLRQIRTLGERREPQTQREGNPSCLTDYSQAKAPAQRLGRTL